MKLKIQASSDKGCVKQQNEDMLSINGNMLRDAGTDILPVSIPEKGTYHLLVADGMGGHEKGEVASQELLERISSFMSAAAFSCAEEFTVAFRNHVTRISDAFNERALLEGQSAVMGCTLSGVIWYSGRILLVNSGDSRTYRYRNGRLTQFSTDDTERGITGNANDRKLLLACIGGGSKGSVTVDDITERLMEEDMILICSDGLTDMVGEDEMEVILSDDYEPATGLVERARDNGGEDNISAIVALIGEGDFASGISDEDYIDDDGRFDAWA